MIPVDQRSIHDPDNGKIGDCLSAVLASLLHLPIENIPVFFSDDWHKELNAWLRQFGLAFISYNVKDYQDCLKDWGIEGIHHEVSGPSPRFPGKNLSHATVGLDGKMVFDPHPSKEGLEEVHYHGVFVVLEPWRMVEAGR